MSNDRHNAMVDSILNQEIGDRVHNILFGVGLIQEFKIRTNTYDAAYGRTG